MMIVVAHWPLERCHHVWNFISVDDDKMICSIGQFFHAGFKYDTKGSLLVTCRVLIHGNPARYFFSFSFFEKKHDISYVVHFINCLMLDPQHLDMIAVFSILRYLTVTVDLVLIVAQRASSAATDILFLL